MVSPGLMKRLVVASFVIFALGCSSGGVPDPKAPVACTQKTCPKGWCTLKISFHERCPDTLQAEVLINDALEPMDASAKTTFTSVGSIPVGETGTVYVRADDWQWGPPLLKPFVCKDPKKDGAFTLDCSSGGAAASSK